MTEPRLQVHDLTRVLDGRAVVHRVSFRVNAGGVTCLLGPSGCGKSTSLRMIAGVDRPDGGTVHLDGRMVSGPDVFIPAEKRQIGMMFQDFALFPHLTVRDNVAFGLTGRDKTTRAEQMLDRIGMARFAAQFPHELSGGEQQRVALARALAPRPAVMLMDEPFSGLDDRLRDGVREEAMDLLRSEGAAVVMVTHEPEEAMRVADQIVLLRDGQVIQEGAPYQLYNAPVDRETAAFFSDINTISAQALDGMAQTPFGAFDCRGIADGTPVDVVVRPQHVAIDFDRGGQGPSQTADRGTAVPAAVERARFLGGQSLVDFRMDTGARIQAQVPGVFLPPQGSLMWLALPRNRCFVFAQSASAA